eukprot:7931479-Alexandrium_andersonii.AAC.1
MSASLVGSEMCIRDSAKRVAAEAQQPGRPRSNIQGLRGFWIWRLRLRACLLYTSDAADDM